MLGGGPKVSTLEVAIYTSLRFSFDLPAAGILSAIQLLISSAVILSLSRLNRCIGRYLSGRDMPCPVQINLSFFQEFLTGLFFLGLSF